MASQLGPTRLSYAEDALRSMSLPEGLLPLSEHFFIINLLRVHLCTYVCMHIVSTMFLKNTSERHMFLGLN